MEYLDFPTADSPENRQGERPRQDSHAGIHTEKDELELELLGHGRGRGTVAGGGNEEGYRAADA